MHNTKSKPSDYEHPVVTAQFITSEEGFASSTVNSIDEWNEEDGSSYSLYF